MRRAGLILAGLGTFLIVFAILVASWVTGQVIKFPLNQYATVTLTDPNATYFSASKLTQLTGVNMEATYTIKGNAAAGSSSTAVWNQFVYVYDQTNKQPVQTITRTFAFNRRTAQLVNCCGASVSGNSSVVQSGYVGYVLPIGTKKQTYDVFDTNLSKPVPFTYAGIGDVDGTQAYKFTENVAPTKNGTQTVPGSLVNQAAASVTLPQYYQTQTTYWIDPVTGALLNVTQNEKLTLRNNDGSQALVLFSANLAATQDSIDGLVAIDNDQVSKASLVGTLLPLATGIVGLLLLIIGIALFRRPDRDTEAVPSRREPELAAAEPEAAARSRSLVPGLDDEPREATVESPVVREAAVSEAAAGDDEAAREKAAPADRAVLRATGGTKARAAEAATAGAATAESEAAESKAAESKAAEAKAAEGDAAASDATAAGAETKAAAEAKAEDKAAAADAAPASPAAASEAVDAKTEAVDAKTEAAQADATAQDAKAEEAKAEVPEAAAGRKAGAAPSGAATAEIPAADADTAEAPAASDATAETPAPAGSSRRRRGTHRR